MRKILILIIAILSSLICFAQIDNNIIVDKLDSKRILNLLFSPVSIDSNNVAFCKPDILEKIEFGPIKNDLIYTWIDTIIYNKNISIIVFNTNVESNMHNSECHVCSYNLSVAVFTKDKSGYELTSIKKHLGYFGEFGIKPKVEIEKFKDSEYFLKIEDFHSGCGGSDYKTYAYFDLKRFNEKFKYCYSLKWHSQDFFGDNYESENKFSELIHFSKGLEYDSLKVVTMGFETDDKLRSKPIKGTEIKRIKFESEEVYYYDDYLEQYKKK